MTARPDWTPGPAKWVVVLILTGAVVAGLAYSVARRGAAWRVEPGRPSDPLPRGGAALADLPQSAGERGGRERSRASSPLAAKINVNTASAAELELLPGVGPAIAQRIIEERETGGAFRRVEDLGRVRGIGPRTIEQLRPHIVVD